MSGEPYRKSGEVASSERRRELAQPAQSSSWPIFVLVFLVLLVGAIIGGLSQRFAPTMAVTVLVAAALAYVLRLIGDNGIVFAVADSTLVVSRGRRAGTTLLRVPLSDLLDVRLDTEEMTGPSVTFSMTPGYGHQLAAPPLTDESRVILLLRNNEPFPLTDRYGSVLLATEWAGDIRRFLRSHGWLPFDERGEEA